MSSLSLDAVEARVLGVLMEKEITTPDAYPLTLNGVTTACNQKSNRDPVSNYSEGQVRDALERLVSRTLVREPGGAGGRTRRFAHRMDSRLFGNLEFDRAERAILCVLLLRGAQTPGEIRSRTARLAEFADLDALQAVLDALAAREDGPHVQALPREPGRREVRYRHLFGPQQAPAPRPVMVARDATDAEDESGPPAGWETERRAASPAAEPAVSGAAAGAGSTTLDDLARRLDAAEARISVLERALAEVRPAAAGQVTVPAAGRDADD